MLSLEIYLESLTGVDRLARVGNRLPLGLTFYDSVPACIYVEHLINLSRHISTKFVNV